MEPTTFETVEQAALPVTLEDTSPSEKTGVAPFVRHIDDYKKGFSATLRAFIYQAARNGLFLLLIFLKQFKLAGREHIPTDNTPFIVVANHVSNWDPPVVGCVLRGHRNVAFMAKQELMTPSPWLNAAFNWVGTIPVDRDSVSVTTLRVAKQVALLPNWVLGVFPEGHRNVDGTAKPKKGAAFMARMTGCAILPIGIAYAPQGARAQVGPIIPVAKDADLDTLTEHLMNTLHTLKTQAQEL